MGGRGVARFDPLTDSQTDRAVLGVGSTNKGGHRGLK